MRSLASTPLNITDAILEFCNSLQKDIAPFYITNTPSKNAQAGECFANVDRYILENDGCAQYGWIIWQTSSYLLQAEFHAVYRSVKGNFLDITPYTRTHPTILFLPSSDIYANQRIQNIYHSTSSDIRVTNFIDAVSALSQFEEMLSSQKTLDALNLEENTQIAKDLKVKFKEIETAIEAFESMVLDGRTRNDICFCGSGKKLKKCCG